MNPDQPIIPDPDDPAHPLEPVSDPPLPTQPDSITVAAAASEAYDDAEADSFPASDPPAASEPGVG